MLILSDILYSALPKSLRPAFSHFPTIISSFSPQTRGYYYSTQLFEGINCGSHSVRPNGKHV